MQVCLSLLPRRFCKGTLNRPASVETLLNGAVAKSHPPAPIHQGRLLPTKFDDPIGPHVVALLSAGLPGHVSWLVTHHVVEPSEGMGSRRRQTNIAEESLEGVHPSLAHDDSPPTVVGEGGIRWITAARDHRLPRLVFLRRFAAPPVTVFHIAGPQCWQTISLEAAAGPCVAACKGSLSNFDCTSTLAAAYPYPLAPLASRSNQGDWLEPTEFFCGFKSPISHDEIISCLRPEDKAATV